MKKVDMYYNPYKMITKMKINDVGVCGDPYYEKVKQFIKHEIPLQTWIEPIEHLKWKGFVNEVSSPENNDEVEVFFSGRKLDWEDLQRAVEEQSKKRSPGTKVKYTFKHKAVLDDGNLSENIEDIVKELQSERFRKLVLQRSADGELRKHYDALDKNYKLAKESDFYIVFAGLYSSGKSTLLNALIRHDILPASSDPCTSKNCRICHDGSLEATATSLVCYDKNGKVIVEKVTYYDDEECAAAFQEICPSKNEENIDKKYQDVDMMEVGVNLSHLYPDGMDENDFRIVLIDTPGMNNAQARIDGINQHAQIAMEAVSMDTRPMVILCLDANYQADEKIGEFMREIICQSEEERGGFNDRFLFLMNKSDTVNYKDGEKAENKKTSFAKYLTDVKRWGIKESDTELQKLAEKASHFVPRVFMTAGGVALAIQRRAFDFSAEERNKDKYKSSLFKIYRNFAEEVCRDEPNTDFCLAGYCDIPGYRKEELENEFIKALENQDNVKAAEIQCGLLSVECAIRDYIERYAYPIKVRKLLDTFEDILEDVSAFQNAYLRDLQKTNQEMGEKEGERKEAGEEKKDVEGKINELKKFKEKIESISIELRNINFNSAELKKTIGDVHADVEDNRYVSYIRTNPKVYIGNKSHAAVEKKIKKMSLRVEKVFDKALGDISKKLEKIQKKHGRQIDEVFGKLKHFVEELENAELFQEGEYNFANNILWKKEFAKIDMERFTSDMLESIVDGVIKKEKRRNAKKDEYIASENPFKQIAACFMSDYKTVVVYSADGYFSNETLIQGMDKYWRELTEESDVMEKSVKEIMEYSKTRVEELMKELTCELDNFYRDIREKEMRIEELGRNKGELEQEIQDIEEIRIWLDKLKKRLNF